MQNDSRTGFPTCPGTVARAVLRDETRPGRVGKPVLHDREKVSAGGRHWTLVTILAAGLVATAILAIFRVAPTEESMGDAQRIVYIHVSVAWLGLAGFLVMGSAGGMYLLRRDLAWDHWAQSAAELGWLCSGLTLVTGSLWAHAAWNTWWTWDPRLLTSFILWAGYCGYLLVRGSLDDPHRRARLGAVLAIVGLLDVPLVVMATRWFRAMHPTSPGMEPTMRAVLLLSILSFTVFFALLLVLRQRQLHLECLLAGLEQQAMYPSRCTCQCTHPANATDAGRLLRKS
jgi:heme exporter protein C